MNFFQYEVEAYEEDTYELYKEIGLTYTETYFSAINNLFEYYGKKNVISIFLKELDQPYCFPMKEEILEEIVNE